MDYDSISLEDFIKIATPKQKKILRTLKELAIKEKEIVEKIQKINNAVDYDGLYCADEDSGITICETEDDARVVSMGLRKELKKIRKNIFEQLVTAMSPHIGMEKVGIIQRQYLNYLIMGSE